MTKRRVDITKILDKDKKASEKNAKSQQEYHSKKIVDTKRYETEIEPLLFQISILARDGATQDEIAEFLGMSRATLYRYREAYPKLEEAIEAGKEALTTAVESSLEKLCNGYTYKEFKNTYRATDRVDETGKSEYKKVSFDEFIKIKHPDLSAIIFFLTNTKPEKWKKQIDVNSISKNLNATMFAGNSNIDEKLIKNALKEFHSENFGNLQNGNSSIDMSDFDDDVYEDTDLIEDSDIPLEETEEDDDL